MTKTQVRVKINEGENTDQKVSLKTLKMQMISSNNKNAEVSGSDILLD